MRTHGRHTLLVRDSVLASFCALCITDNHIPVGDFFPPAFNCPHERERIGILGDGGKWVCGLSRLTDKRDCVVYSFGQ